MTLVASGWTDYPTFRRVEDIGRDAYEELLFSCVPRDDPQGMVPSDYVWLSLMAWCPDAEAARVPGGLCLRMPEYHGDNWLTSLIGREVGIEVVRELLEVPELGGGLHYVPKWIAGPLAVDPRFSVQSDRDNFDYIRDIPEQIAAEGPRFREVRRSRRRFVRTHPTAATIIVPLEGSRRSELRDVFVSWVVTRDRSDDSDARDEWHAIERLIGRTDVERCVLCLLHIDGVIAGFSIDEALPGGMGVGHFMKSGTRADGAWQHLDLACLRELASRGVALMNFEQDLGVPGLRQRKTWDKPVFLLEKYVVTLAEDH